MKTLKLELCMNLIIRLQLKVFKKQLYSRFIKKYIYIFGDTCNMCIHVHQCKASRR